MNEQICILYIDDEPDIRLIVEMSLRMRPEIDVRTADGGEEGLRLLAGGLSPDLVMIDVMMPGMSGPTLVARIEVSRPDIRVLYISGYADDTMAQHGVFEDGMRFLRKPFTPDELARTVRQVLD